MSRGRCWYGAKLWLLGGGAAPHEILLPPCEFCLIVRSVIKGTPKWHFQLSGQKGQVLSPRPPTAPVPVYMELRGPSIPVAHGLHMLAMRLICFNCDEDFHGVRPTFRTSWTNTGGRVRSALTYKSLKDCCCCTVELHADFVKSKAV